MHIAGGSYCNKKQVIHGGHSFRAHVQALQAHAQ